jgi:hypothetical protein
MSTPVLTYSALVAEANVLLGEAASRHAEDIAGHFRRSAEALCRAARLALAVRGAADNCLDRPPVDTRRDLLEAVRDFELGEQYAPRDLEGRQ